MPATDAPAAAVTASSGVRFLQEVNDRLDAADLRAHEAEERADDAELALMEEQEKTTKLSAELAQARADPKKARTELEETGAERDLYKAQIDMVDQLANQIMQRH